MNPNRSGVGPLSVSIRSELSIMRNRVAETVVVVCRAEPVGDYDVC